MGLLLPERGNSRYQEVHTDIVRKPNNCTWGYIGASRERISTTTSDDYTLTEAAFDLITIMCGFTKPPTWAQRLSQPRRNAGHCRNFSQLSTQCHHVVSTHLDLISYGTPLFLVAYVFFVSRAGEPFVLGYEKNTQRQLCAAREFESETGRVVEHFQ